VTDNVVPIAPPAPARNVLNLPTPKTTERWVDINKTQRLKLVPESRPNHGRRLLRIDLYEGETKIASFYRRGP
jgi:hypothetical protein